jgi:D-serine deaminase-like pyridoxal phosphate-dependent protein
VIHSGDGKVVVDAGAKILTKDRQTWLDSFGHLPIAPEARVERVYDNHGVIRMAAEDVTPRVGDRITIVPNHICPVVNLLDVMVFVGADGEPFDVAVDLRGHLA